MAAIAAGAAVALGALRRAFRRLVAAALVAPQPLPASPIGPPPRAGPAGAALLQVLREKVQGCCPLHADGCDCARVRARPCEPTIYRETSPAWTTPASRWRTLPTRHRAAVLAHHGRFSIAPVIAIAAAAAIVGDNPGYLIGRTGGRTLLERPSILEHHRRQILSKGEPFFRRHGPKAVFLGRWVAGLRIAAAWPEGINHMPWRIFVFCNATARHRLGTSLRLLAYSLGPTAEHIFQTHRAGRDRRRGHHRRRIPPMAPPPQRASDRQRPVALDRSRAALDPRPQMNNVRPSGTARGRSGAPATSVEVAPHEPAGENR